MKRRLLTLLAVVAACFAVNFSAARADDFETLPLWPDVAPGEKADAEKPTLEYWKPAEKTSDACMIVCPGGGYHVLCAARGFRSTWRRGRTRSAASASFALTPKNGE